MFHFYCDAFLLNTVGFFYIVTTYCVALGLRTPTSVTVCPVLKDALFMTIVCAQKEEDKEQEEEKQEGDDTVGYFVALLAV